MFEDEAGFGRISEPANCWAPPKCRPSVPNQKIREYRTVYGAVSPQDGASIFMVLEKGNTENMNIFLKALSEKFPDDLILLILDQASYHKSKGLKIPKNITFFHLLPRCPQMNPIETVWREIRKRGFKNKAFKSIAEVIDKFYEVISKMTQKVFQSITSWPWIESVIGGD